MAERITGHTELIGLIATPIRHSSSPAMHNEAFAKLGLDYAYLAFEVDNDTLEDTVKGFRAMKVRGWNVSMPNKTVIGKYLDKLTPAAEMCGAVNTVVNDNGVLTGTITDGTLEVIKVINKSTFDINSIIKNMLNDNLVNQTDIALDKYFKTKEKLNIIKSPFGDNIIITPERLFYFN